MSLSLFMCCKERFRTWTNQAQQQLCREIAGWTQTQWDFSSLSSKRSLETRWTQGSSRLTCLFCWNGLLKARTNAQRNWNPSQWGLWTLREFWSKGLLRAATRHRAKKFGPIRLSSESARFCAFSHLCLSGPAQFDGRLWGWHRGWTANS